ncbi:MAG: AAA family ATPase [Actinomycetota bacterium]|nr:AAA family ATPase [Actinomycetota bacterium]
MTPGRLCTACPAELPVQARFCPSCGERVRLEGGLEIRKTVTVLFCDLVGSTLLSRELDPERFRELTLRYFGLMRDCAERHGGVVEKYIGDAVMAVFGVPVVHEDDALRAVRAAAQMREALAGFNAADAQGLGVTLNVRIAVNTGPVVAAADPAAAEALVSGETVNLAARLEQHAEPGEVLLGPLTCHALEGVVDYEPAAPVALKGFAQPVTPGRLVAVGEPASAISRRLDLVLVNRHGEMAALRETFGRARRDRSCQLVTLHGDAGIGKSRLAAEFTRWARSAGALVADGRCPGYGTGGSLLALAQAIRRLLAEWVPPEALSADVAEALTMLNAGFLADDSPGVIPGETVWAICRVLKEAGRDRPLALILDDMHWADSGLVRAVAGLAAQLSEVAVTVLCLARPEFVADESEWIGHLPNARLQTMGPLSEDDCRLLIAELDEVVAHDSELALRAMSRAEGNPLYLEQLVSVIAGGSAQAIPVGINGLIACRLDLLAVGERRILGWAAVAGRDFTPAELVAAAEDDLAGRLARVLAALVGRRLIRPAVGEPAPAFRFESALIHEVAYDSMPKSWRAAAHERLATWLANSRGDTEAAGTHWERAWLLGRELGTPEAARRPLADLAVDALRAAGIRALASGDPRHASGLLSRALRLCPDDDPRMPDLLLQAGEAQVMAGDTESGHGLLEQARARARARARAGAGANATTEAHAELQLAYLSPTRQFSASLQAARQTLPIFERAGDHLGVTRAWLRIGVVEQSRGRHASAAAALSRALGHAARLDAGLEQATVLGALAVSLWIGPLSAARAVARCRSLLSEYAAGHRTVRAALLCPLAMLASMTGEHDQAAAFLDEADRVVSDLGNARACIVLPIFVGAAKWLAGDLDAAEATVRQAYSASLGMGDPQLTETASRDLARIQLLRGRVDEAAELAAAPVPDDMPAAAADRHGVRARVLARQGLGEQARGLSAQALASARRTDSPVSRATACLDTAVMLRDLGDRPGSRDMAREAETWFSRKGHVIGVAWSRHVLEGTP